MPCAIRTSSVDWRRWWTCDGERPPQVGPVERRWASSSQRRSLATSRRRPRTDGPGARHGPRSGGLVPQRPSIQDRPGPRRGPDRRPTRASGLAIDASSSCRVLRPGTPVGRDDALRCHSTVEQGLGDPVKVEDVVLTLMCEAASQYQDGPLGTFCSDPDPRPLLRCQATQPPLLRSCGWPLGRRTGRRRGSREARASRRSRRPSGAGAPP